MATLDRHSRHALLSPFFGGPRKRGRAKPPAPADPPPQEPSLEPAEPDEPDEIEIPWTDDAYWDVFIADDGDPLPEPGDFWIDNPEEMHASAIGMELV